MTVLYFAWVRQKIGTSEEVFDLPDGVRTVADLAAHLIARGDGYADAFADLMASANKEIAARDERIEALEKKVEELKARIEELEEGK